MHSDIDYHRFFAIRANQKTRTFHTMIRAGEESSSVISEDGTQMWHISMPEKKYNVITDGFDLKELMYARSTLITVYKGLGYELVKSHKDERLLGAV
jgi:hypothetical protein